MIWVIKTWKTVSRSENASYRKEKVKNGDYGWISEVVQAEKIMGKVNKTQVNKCEKGTEKGDKDKTKE